MSASAALHYLENLGAEKKAVGSSVEVWCTNLEYDLCNLFDRNRISEVFLRFGRSYLCGARWRGVDFRDTVRHLPASVADLGELVGLRKKEGDLFKGKRPTFPLSARMLAKYRTRCKRDAAITYQAAGRFYESYAAFGERARMTLASTALRIWQEKFWKREVRRPAPVIWQAALDAYHGGRTQAFAHGTFADVQVVDVASMYPWAMTVAPMPLPWGLMRRVPKGGTLQAFGVYRVKVTSHLAIPRLPVRTDKGTIFPNGTWIGWYVGEELQAFARAGGRVAVLGGYEFGEKCDPFRGYVDAMFKRKQRSRGMARVMFKLLLNSLYGKFGQQGRQVRAVTVAKFIAMSPRPKDAREWNGLVIYSEDSAPPPWSNNVWCAFVTARARVRLVDEMNAIVREGGRVLYCDTDSVIFSGGSRRYPDRAPRLGAFERRGRYKNLLLVGKKEYALDCGRGRWLPIAKGVPFAERMRYLRTGVAEFDRPARMRESARQGLTVNVWRRVTKERRVRLEKGVLQTDGTLATPTMKAGRTVVR